MNPLRERKTFVRPTFRSISKRLSFFNEVVLYFVVHPWRESEAWKRSVPEVLH